MDNVITWAEEIPHGAVIYTDGGADTSAAPGQALRTGWGLHGYTYPIDEQKKLKFTKKKDAPSQYCYYNASKISKEFKPGTRQVKTGKHFTIWDEISIKDELRPVEPDWFMDFWGGVADGTVSVVEIRAMHEALAFLLANPLISQGVIVGDSEYVIKTMTEYMPKWIAKGWLKSNGQPPEHLPAWQTIHKQIEELLARGVTIRFGWCKAHNGEPGNERVDQNATRGKICVFNKQLEDTYLVTPAKGYIQKTKLSSRLMDQTWWYGLTTAAANQHPEFPEQHVYFFGNHGKAEEENDLVGKRTASAKVSIMVMKEAEPVLDSLTEYLRENMSDRDGRVVLGRLSNIVQAERYATLGEYGARILYPSDTRRTVHTSDGAVVLEELRPTYHGFRLVEELTTLLQRMRDAVDGGDNICLTDVTNLVWTKTEGKKVEYKPAACVNAPNRTVTFDVGYNTGLLKGTKAIPLKLGADIPQRNTLNAVGGPETRLFVVTWKRAPGAFKYATLLDTPDGLLFSCSLAANLVSLVGGK